MYIAYATEPIREWNEKTNEWRVLGWRKLGIVSSMEEAIKRFGGHPVLERCDV